MADLHGSRPLEHKAVRVFLLRSISLQRHTGASDSLSGKRLSQPKESDIRYGPV